MIGNKGLSLRQYKRNIGRNPDEALPMSNECLIGVTVIREHIPLRVVRKTKYGKIMEQLRSPHRSILIPLIEE